MGTQRWRTENELCPSPPAQVRRLLKLRKVEGIPNTFPSPEEQSCRPSPSCRSKHGSSPPSADGGGSHRRAHRSRTLRLAPGRWNAAVFTDPGSDVSKHIFHMRLSEMLVTLSCSIQLFPIKPPRSKTCWSPDEASAAANGEYAQKCQEQPERLQPQQNRRPGGKTAKTTTKKVKLAFLSWRPSRPPDNVSVMLALALAYTTEPFQG